MIAVIGSSGMLGSRVVERLAAAGQDVVATSRRRREGLPTGVTSTVVDLREPDTVRTALQNADAVVIAAHGLNPPGWGNGPRHVDDRGVATVADVLAGTDAHVTLLSVLDPSTDHELDFWRAKRAAELHLERTGLPVAVLRCSAFMEFHALELLGKPLQQGKKAMIIGRGDAVRNMVSVDDVAALVTWVVDRRYVGTLEVVGPINATPNEDVATIASVLGVEPAAMRIPPSVARALSVVPGKLAPNVGRIITTALHDDARDQPREPAALPDGAPVPTRTLSDVVRDHLLSSTDEPTGGSRS